MDCTEPIAVQLIQWILCKQWVFVQTAASDCKGFPRATAAPRSHRWIRTEKPRWTERGWNNAILRGRNLYSYNMLMLLQLLLIVRAVESPVCSSVRRGRVIELGTN